MRSPLLSTATLLAWWAVAACGRSVDVDAASGGGGASVGVAPGTGAGPGGAGSGAPGATGAISGAGPGVTIGSTGPGGGSGTGGGSGAGGGGEGGASPYCEGFGDPCTACIADGCGARWCACNDNPECLALLSCNAACNDEPTCLEDCRSAHEEGISDLFLVADCAEEVCGVACPSVVGVTDCQECLFADCATASNRCAAEPSCGELFTCLVACDDLDLGCNDACYDAHPEGIAPLQELLQCASEACPDVCG